MYVDPHYISRHCRKVNGGAAYAVMSSDPPILFEPFPGHPEDGCVEEIQNGPQQEQMVRKSPEIFIL